MKKIVQWAIKNAPAMNTLLIAALVVGAVSLATMRREVFPEFELEIILVTVPYPGATPEEVEEGVCQKIEESVQSIDGIKKQTSIAQEGAGFLVLELNANVNVQKVLNEVRSEIDQIASFPQLAEEPDIRQVTMRTPAIRLAVLGPDQPGPEAEKALRAVAEEVRDELLQIQPAGSGNPLAPSAKAVISSANIMAAKPYQIDVEISEDTLREYGLSLRDVANMIRRQNTELSGGRVRTEAQEILVVGQEKRITGDAIEEIEILSPKTGDALRLKDLGRVRDGFADETRISRINGRPGLVVSVDRTSDEDLFTVVDAVKEHMNTKQLPPGYELSTWYDVSLDVQDRLDMLVQNGLLGLVLVFLVLAVFLELRLAFWVALGIPVAILGAGGVLMFGGQTLNMLTMFAFLMALGIVVDDAIVIGENIYHHRNSGKGFVRAAIDGTVEVIPAVSASVCTTIIAFSPMFFVAGVMGKFIAVLPFAVIAMLVISLIESAVILPCHLAHRDNLVFRIVSVVFYPLKFLLSVFHRLNQRSDRVLSWMVYRTYLPVLRWSLRNPSITLCSAVAVLILAVGVVRSGITPFNLFPKLDTRVIEATVVFPNGTPAGVTDRTTREIERAIQRINADYQQQYGNQLVLLRHRVVGEVSAEARLGAGATTDGSHVGRVTVELVSPEERPPDFKSDKVIDMWRKEAGTFAGVDSVTFQALSFGPASQPIEFKLLANQRNMQQLEAAVQRCKQQLASIDGVFDIKDDWRPGKPELRVSAREEQAQAYDVTQADISETLRAAYYGEEVMRLQRGRHEVKLMVRYPEEERKSLAAFSDMRIRVGDAEIPITEVAQERWRRGVTEINRVNQLRSITISADVDESRANAYQIVAQLKEPGGFIDQLQADFPATSVRWEGQEEQRKESIQSLFVGFAIALLAMFVVLTIEFRSYLQPLLVMLIIPFGFIGAVAGHAIFGMDLTLFSLFGLVALTGVVVNDSIVLVDFINRRVRAGMPLQPALLEAGRRRFRAVLLTSVTTIAGLLPMLAETSFQAQILIPMANALAFGLMLATVLVLLLVPTLYYVYARLTRLGVDVWDQDAPTDTPSEFDQVSELDAVDEDEPSDESTVVRV